MLMELREVEVGYHGRPILPPIGLRLEAGSFLGIVGPNGSGKTTLVRTLLGLQSPVRGQVIYEGGHRPRVGYVPQGERTDASWPLTAVEVALMGRYGRIGIGRRPGAKDWEAARGALAHTGVEDLAGKAFHSLSGGQRQRVLMARALCGEPELLVLDEPTSGMDIVAEQSMLELIAHFPKEKLAVVMVSHQLAAVANYVRELVLVDRDRFSVEAGPVSEILTSERLSALYKVPVTVQESASHAYKSIFIDAPRPKG